MFPVKREYLFLGNISKFRKNWWPVSKLLLPANR